jgi:hypothetical protein
MIESEYMQFAYNSFFDAGYHLLFSVERAGKRFALTRTLDVSEPVRCKALTLGAEDLLSA